MKLQFFVVLLILIAAPVQAAERYQQRTALPDHVNLPPLLAFLNGSWTSSDPGAKAVEAWSYQDKDRLIGTRATEKPDEYQTFLVSDGVAMRYTRNTFLNEPTERFLGGANCECTNRATLTVRSLRETSTITFKYDSPSPDELNLEVVEETTNGHKSTKTYHYKRVSPTYQQQVKEK